MLEQLIKIYNTLTTVSTRGEDTLTMADCLRALRSVVMDMQQAEMAAKQQQPMMTTEEE